MITMDQHGCIVEFNPAAERLFGYRREAVLGQELAGLIIPPSLRAQHRRGLAQYLATGNGPLLGKRVEISAMRANSSEFPVELSITQISQAGPPLFTGFLRDLSERKRVEQAVAIARQFHDSLEHVFGAADVPAQSPDPLLPPATESERAAVRQARLTKQEQVVLARLVQDEGSNQELAEQLGVSASTIRYHLGNIFKKLQLQNRTELVVYAIHHGLVVPPGSSGR